MYDRKAHSQETRRSRRLHDHLEETQPGYSPRRVRDSLSDYQPVRVSRRQQRRRSELRACIWGMLLVFALLVLGYLQFPGRYTILILGIDRTPEENAVGRSDTNIIMDVQVWQAEVRTLAIPRDLWVNIPNYGENRINTAHFFGEGAERDGGPALTAATIKQNFGIDSDYYIRIKLEKFPAVIDSLGGIKITLPYKMGGLKKGEHKLNGEQALAFVRDRSGSDDFQRMQQGQLFTKALVKNMLNPLKWLRLPFFLAAISDVVDTDIPQWHWPRLGFALLRARSDGIHSSSISRKMVNSWITPDGAQVLLPDWAQIIPFTLKSLGYQK